MNAAWWVGVGLSAVLLAAGCGLDGGSAPSSLDGRTFLLESSDGFEPVTGTTVRLSFREGMVSVHAGCNGQGGDYQLEGGRLVIGGVGGSAIGCDLELHAQDDWLAAFLSSSPQLVLDGDRLTLIGDDATLVFLDREVADPDRPLEGTLWTVDTLIDGAAASNVPVSPQPTILFDDDGSFQVNITCSPGGGRYVVDGDRLTLNDVTFADLPCLPAFAEQHVRSVMSSGVVTFEIEAARLKLQHGDTGLEAMAP